MASLTSHQLKSLPRETRMLEIGCGPKRVWSHSKTLDINVASNADVIHDLNVVPYPFPDNAFDIVVAEHVLEHLDSVILVLEELHRICRPGGVIYIEVPHFSSRDHFTDPTHKHAFSVSSMEYFIPAEGGLFMFNYSATARFRRRKAEITGPTGKWWQRIVDRLAKKNPTRFEREFAFIFPREHVNFELEVIK